MPTKRFFRTLAFNRPTFNRIIVALLVFVMIGNPAMALEPPAIADMSMPAAAAEAARILDVGSDVQRIQELSNQLSLADDETVRSELLSHKCAVLRKILLGYLEVRETSDQIDVDLGYTYDAIAVGSRRRDRLVQMCNVANFTQFGVQFSLAAAFRLAHNLPTNNLLTCTGGGGTLVTSLLGMMAQRTGSSKEKHPPNALADFFDLNPPMEYKLPEMIHTFVNSKAPGSNVTRKDVELSHWKRLYRVDSSRPEKLAAIASSAPNMRRESLALLNNRLVLLYALNALIEEFDSDLIVLLRYLETTSPVPVTIEESEYVNCLAKLTPQARDAAKLLDIEKQVAELILIRQKNGRAILSHQQLRLEVLALEKILGGALEVRKAVDRVDQEKHYQYDVVMSELTGRRDRFLQRCAVTNFMTTGILKSTAGLCFYTGYPAAGSDILETMTGITTLVAGVSIAASRGGKRKIDCPPNALVSMLNLDVPKQYHLSSLMTRFLDSPAPSGKSITRREQLLQHWKQHRLLQDKENAKMCERLADMPSEKDRKVDTISLTSQRLRMLFDLRTELESFDNELLALLRHADADPNEASEEAALANYRDALARLTRSKIDTASTNLELLSDRILVVRRTLRDSLDVRATVDKLDDELTVEYTIQGEMVAKTNKRIEITNGVNFLQNGITTLISGGLAYHGIFVAGNQMNIVSGSAVVLLAFYSMWQARGGKRPSEAKPNMLGQVLDVPGAPTNTRFSNYVWKHLNSPAPANFASGNMTRREWLISHWKKSGAITLDTADPQMKQKLAATGPAYNPKSENLKLIKNRIYMLSELRTQVETLDYDLLSTLRTIN